MLSFLVIAAPRSGTAWTANWLSTDRSLCYHGLSGRVERSRWDALDGAQIIGTAETALWHAKGWIAAHCARKLIIHRSAQAICESIQMPELAPRISYIQHGLRSIEGMHVEFDELFEHPRPIFEHLLGFEFDAQQQRRHEALKQLQVTCMPKRMTFDVALVRKLAAEIACTT